MRYKRWSRITTDRFSNSERRKRKVLGRSGGILPLWNFSDFNFLNTLFLGFWVIQTGYWPVADESLQIGGSLHQGQFPYCSGYEARRVQTIFKINLKIFINIKNVFIIKNLTDSHKSICRNWCGSAPEVIQDYTISYRFALKSCLLKINEFEQSGRFELA